MDPVIALSRMPDASGELLQQQRKHKYCLTGIFDEAAAMSYCVATIPLLIVAEGLYRQNISMSSPGGDLWYADVQYGPVPKAIGEWSISGSTTGGTVHRNYSLECVNAYTSSGADADRKSLAIGLRSDDQIEGADIVVPQGQRTYTVRYAKGVITESYMDYVEALTGIVNSATWHNRPAGEVLFMGCPSYSTSLTGSAECSVAYQFSFGKNLVGQTLGDITGIAKDGHDLLDVVFESAADGKKKPNASPEVVRIHRVYRRLPFLDYLGF